MKEKVNKAVNGRPWNVYTCSAKRYGVKFTATSIDRRKARTDCMEQIRAYKQEQK
jgi:hypothetical protein